MYSRKNKKNKNEIRKSLFFGESIKYSNNKCVRAKKKTTKFTKIITYLIVNIKIGFCILNTVPCIIHLAFEIVPIFFQFTY